MSMTRTGQASLAMFALVAGLTWAGCDGSGTNTEGARPGHGVVRAVDLARREITLEHGDIPGLMKAMTMTFAVASDASLEGLEPGVSVDFEVAEQQGVYTLTAIRRSGP